MSYARSIVFAGLFLGLVGLKGELPAIAQTTAQTTTLNSDTRKAAVDEIFQKGIKAYETDQYAAAIQWLTQAVEQYREIQDRNGERRSLGNLGLVYEALKNYPKAIEFQKQSLALAIEMKHRKGEGQSLSNLARAYRLSGNQTQSIDYGIQSLTIARELKDRETEGITLTDLGISYQSLDEFTNQRWKAGTLSTDFTAWSPATRQSIVEATKALEYLQAGLKIAQEIKSRPLEIRALATLGRTYAVLHDYDNAIITQQQQLTIAQSMNDATMTANTLSFLGLLYGIRGDYRTAIQYHKQAIEIYREPQNRYNAAMQKIMSESKVPTAYAPLGEFRQTLMDLGDTYNRQGDYTNAIQAYQEAFGPSITLRQSGGNLDIVLLRKLSSTLAKAGQFSEAASTLRTAIDQEEIFRRAFGYGISGTWKANDANRIEFAARQEDDYRQLQQMLVRQNQTDNALEIAEESRSRTFVELLSARMNNRPLSDDLPPPPKLDTIRKIAKDQNATLVEYSIINPEQLYIWVIKPTGDVTFKISKLAKTDPIEQIIADSRSSIAVVYPNKPKPTTEPASELNLTLRKLHQTLIEPIASDLPKDPNQRVVFLPQGELFLVPFAALQDARGKYLIEHHTISTAPSIQTLELTRKKAKLANTRGKMLVVGDPTMPIFEGSQLPDLPGAKQEAIDIGKIFNVEPIIGNQATKAAVFNQLKTASIVHLATHGLLNAVKDNVPGAIALAPSGSDNGLLTASEIFDLKLTSDLVVLSACDTGRGVIKGDGVIGLSRSFIAAGVPSVVVSLWAVNDNSTSVLMSDFYRNLKINPNKAQSMRQAMLNTMKQYPNPRDWAAFTLVGESDRPD
jgi:CHAT domain-containing protein